MRAVCSVFVPAADAAARARAAARRSSLEEDRRELVVVVLAGVDEQLLVALAQQPRDGRGLDELRPVADDRDDLHAALGRASRGCARANALGRRAASSGPGAAGSVVAVDRARPAAPRACVEARNASLRAAQLVAA